MARRTVLILGANGRFGAAAVEAFAAAGWRVLAQARRAPAQLPEGAEALRLPLDDAAALANAAAGAEVVVHAVNPPYDQWDGQMLPLARQGMDVAERLDALFMLPGNVYGFGEGMPARLTEETPEQPTTGKGRLRVALEAEMRDRAEAGRFRAVVVRAGDFYGSGQGSWLDLIIAKDLAKGRLVYPGPLNLPHAWAYLPDLARAFVAAAERSLGEEAPAFEVLHFAGHTLTGAQFLDLLEAAAADIGAAPATALDRGWKRAGMPWPLIRLLGVFGPTLKAVAEMSYLWRIPHALDSTRLVARAGPIPDTPPRQALAMALLDLGLGDAQPAP
jgi:nucleoside-diphosphate-sugar epimerase